MDLHITFEDDSKIGFVASCNPISIRSVSQREVPHSFSENWAITRQKESKAAIHQKGS